MEPYFPDASLVDWVGTSLYNNKYQFASSPTKGVDNNEMYFGIGDYADPVKNLSHTADLAKKYNKPIIITEGGSGYLSGNADTTTFAADRIREAYTTLDVYKRQEKNCCPCFLCPSPYRKAMWTNGHWRKQTEKLASAAHLQSKRHSWQKPKAQT